MSRTQQSIIAVLSAAVVLVFGCLGSYLLVYATRGVPLWPPAPSDRSAGIAVDSVEPPASPGATDYGYRLCYQDVAEAWSELLEDTASAIAATASGAEASCATAAELDLQARALELKTAHDGCTGPSDAHLQAAQGHLDSSLTEGMDAVSAIGNFCAGTGEGDWVGESAAHLDRAREQEALANGELEAFYGAY
jgi:hypothetical protein